MNAALKIKEPIVEHLQGPEPSTPHESKQSSVRLINAIILVCMATLLAVCSVFLKYQVEEKFLAIEKLDKENRVLDERIRSLEASVQSMMSYDRIVSVLEENSVAVAPPDKTFHIQLNGNFDSLAKAAEAASRANGSM